MKRKDFPEWTPPINGRQYRFTDVDTLVDGTVHRAVHDDGGLYISYKSHASEGRQWFICVNGTSFSGDTLEGAIAKFELQLKRLKREVAKL